MKFRNSLLAAVLVALVGTSAAAPQAPRNRGEASAAWSEDGLQRVKIKGIDVAFVRPGTSLAGYDKVLLGAPSVAFRRDWGKASSNGAVRVRPEDAQRIKDRLAELVSQELAGEFQAGGYVLVQQPADDVLEIDVRITDLYIVAPDVATVARTDVYAVSTGEMTLVAELRDSASGEAVMRVYDHEEGDAANRVRRITRMDNVAEATRLARGWAKTLRAQLDAARAGPAQ